MNLTRHNYLPFFLLYIDNELLAEERRAVEHFVIDNIDLAEELDALQRTVLEPEEGYRFGDKTDLYKSEILLKPPVIAIGRKRILTAAAILLLACGSYWWWKGNIHPAPDAPRVVANTLVPAAAPGTITPVTPDVAKVTVNGIAPVAGVIAQTPSNTRTPLPAVVKALSHTGDSTITYSHQNSLPPVTNTKVLLPAVVGNTSDSVTAEATIVAANNTPHTTNSAGPLTPTSVNNPVTVTSASASAYHSLDDADASDGDNKNLFARTDQVTNGSVKGFFRKASRILKHSTSLSSERVHAETDGDK